MILFRTHEIVINNNEAIKGIPKQSKYSDYYCVCFCLCINCGLYIKGRGCIHELIDGL